MIVIYHDVGGAHSSATAANIHIKKLPMDKVPTASDLLNLPTFDKLKKEDIGHLMYIGDDEFGNKVYTLSRQRKPEVVLPAITDMYNTVTGKTKNEGLYLVDTQPSVNLLMKIGGGASRRFKLVTFGRPIVTKGTLKTYMNIVDIVKKAQNEIKSTQG